MKIFSLLEHEITYLCKDNDTYVIAVSIAIRGFPRVGQPGGKEGKGLQLLIANHSI